MAVERAARAAPNCDNHRSTAGLNLLGIRCLLLDIEHRAN